MLLVPRQLRRAGMTGDVPYYGGRFTPAQAYAAGHPRRAPGPPPAAPATGAGPGDGSLGDTRAALRHLRDTGVLSPQEYDELMTRAGA